MLNLSKPTYYVLIQIYPKSNEGVLVDISCPHESPYTSISYQCFSVKVQIWHSKHLISLRVLIESGAAEISLTKIPPLDFRYMSSLCNILYKAIEGNTHWSRPRHSQHQTTSFADQHSTISDCYYESIHYSGIPMDANAQAHDLLARQGICKMIRFLFPTMPATPWCSSSLHQYQKFKDIVTV